MMTPLLEATDVAKVLGMRIDYVYALCRRGAIPHLRFGRTLRFRPEAVQRWLAESECGVRSPAAREWKGRRADGS
jgi:excisionase family DNA binding protein